MKIIYTNIFFKPACYSSLVKYLFEMYQFITNQDIQNKS